MTDNPMFHDSLINAEKAQEILDKKISQNVYKIEYQIENNNEKKSIYGTAFLCNINYLNNTILPVLITCYHLLNDDFFKKYESLELIQNLNKKEKSIILENIKTNRIIYTDKELDITIIEIKNEDELNIYSFLEIDNSINEENPNL